MKHKILISTSILIMIFLFSGCTMPPKEKKNKFRPKHNYIILLDLSDRLIVQGNQSERDKKIITELYSLFEKKVKKELYIKSRDEIKVVIAPQLGSRIDRGEFEDRLYVNMENIKNIYRNKQEGQRRNDFIANLDTLYKKAVFSKNPQKYYGADIWKYFYEDLKVDYKKDTLTSNYLFILTDGYPIVGKNQNKLGDIKSLYPELHVVLIEASPRAKDMEWDRVMGIWEEWFSKIGVKKYTLIKRGSITKEIEQIRAVLKEGS
ncbi:MAG: hypothetical protein OEW67_09375 [Cyclobacteriaceae bacterium]|nr:hypothetical protein [Cyclobacteriaceae bacterium]